MERRLHIVRQITYAICAAVEIAQHLPFDGHPCDYILVADPQSQGQARFDFIRPALEGGGAIQQRDRGSAVAEARGLQLAVAQHVLAHHVQLANGMLKRLEPMAGMVDTEKPSLGRARAPAARFAHPHYMASGCEGGAKVLVQTDGYGAQRGQGADQFGRRPVPEPETLRLQQQPGQDAEVVRVEGGIGRAVYQACRSH